MSHETLTIYCTVQEAEAIRCAAQAAKRSVSDYIITVALEHMLGTKRTRKQLQQAIDRVRNANKKT